MNLNPAAEGQGCDYERRVARLGRYKLMFDFKDFNSAHTLESQKCVIKHLFGDLDSEWRSWLMTSVSNMWIRGDDDMWFKTMGTLMSGHRMTSIINSILNAAYTRIAIGERLYNSMYFEHVGDDILGSSEDCDTVDSAVRRMLKSGLALQRAKQGCGTHSAEFLRVCFNETVGMGYAARCIAGIVSGNWVSENQLSPRDYTTSLYNGLWNITTRCAIGRDVGLVAYTTVMRRIGLQGNAALQYCTLNGSINGGPVMYGLANSINVNFMCVRRNKRNGARRMVNGIKLPLNATTDYLTNGADVAALTRVGVARGVLARMMLEASHSNLLETRDTDECVMSTPLCQPCVSARRTERSSWTFRQQRKPMGAAAHLAINSMSSAEIRALGRFLRRDMSDMLLPRITGTAFACVGTTYADATTLATDAMGGRDP